MKLIGIIIIFIISSIASAQNSNDEFCINIEEFDKLQNSDIKEIESSVETHYQQIPAISDEENALPDGWLNQYILVSSAECYLYGNHVQKNINKAKTYLTLAKKKGSKKAGHMLASLQLFQSDDMEEQRLGFKYIENEYMQGSAYSAGKLGWAYQRGLGVEQDLNKAIELYEYAAKNGMTYWQYLLSHAYEKGYFGLEADEKKARYWLELKPKIHKGEYNCWIASYYEDGTFPENYKLQSYYRKACNKDNNSFNQDAQKNARAG